MAGLLRKILPVDPLSPKRDYDDDDNDAIDIEYSIALEYSGPLISNIPRVLPIVVNQIPIASKAASPLMNHSSLPVIEPAGKKRPKEPNLRSEPTLCNNSLINSGVSSKNLNVSCESPTLVDGWNDSQSASGDDCQPMSVVAIRKSGNSESPEGQDNSCKILDPAIVYECMCKSSDGIGSCNKLISPNCHDNSRLIEKLCNSSKEGADPGFQNFVNHANLESTESGLTSWAHSSDVVSCKEGYCNGSEETPSHIRGPSSVTSNDLERSNIVREECDGCGAESIHMSLKAGRHGKKVSCCPCLKENQSTEMEVCTVCDARYCCKCVLKAMGSKPQGRKCFACMGLRIHEGMPMSDGIGSSGKLKGPECPENLHVTVGLPDGNNEGADAGFQDYMSRSNSESTESSCSSQGPSSQVFSQKEEDCDKEEIPCLVKRPSVVTFCEPETTKVVQEESESSEVESFQDKPKAQRPGKKGSCYRCSKGNRFTEKEVCIVCGAKYCCNCVLRAMGSMPEGRKCVACIGFRVDDDMRRTLGKCSRMLKNLLTEMEVKQIMRSEISCEANQLPPERVFVNDEPLSQKELVILQSCANPPKKLNPGSYWYDKVSGLWGKMGKPPCQFISPQLSVGGQIRKDASNGNTNVLINNREITKKEFWMLQSAGVQCEGKPHFWVSADGSYQEEGMKNVKGRIWDKTRTKLVCSFLSLPTPPVNMGPCGAEVSGINYREQICKFLLIGEEKSGTSTIYKQAKLVFDVPFSEDECQNIKFIIQSNLYRYIAILLEGRERFEEESLNEKGKRQVIVEPGPSGQFDDKTFYNIGPRLKAFSDWLLKVMESGNLEVIFPAATREYAPFIEELWKDAAFQATYNRRNELDMLPRVATYFLERAVEISRTIYEPSEMDILYAEGISSTNGLSCMEFSFPKSAQEISTDSSDQSDPLLRCQLIRVHPRSLGENCKWLEMFEDVDIVLFTVSLTEYDEFFEDNNGVLVNKMLVSRQFFESIVIHPTFGEKHFLLLLNKYDLLEEKIEQAPLTRCEWFNDFNPVISHNHYRSSRRNNVTPLAQYAFHYIALKFKRLFKSLTDRKLFVSPVTALEPETVDEALRYAREILKWDEEEPTYSNVIESTDFEASSSS